MELVPKVLSLLELISYKFPQVHASINRYFFHQVSTLPEFSPEASLSLGNIFTLIFRKGSQETRSSFVELIMSHLDKIVSIQLLTIALNGMSVHLKEKGEAELAITRLREVIGALPLAKQ